MQLNQTHLPLRNLNKPDNAISGGSTRQEDMPERKFLNQMSEENVQVDEAAVAAWYKHYLEASGKTANKKDMDELRSTLIEMELGQKYGDASWECE